MKLLILLYHYYCRAVVLNSYSGLDFKTTSMRTDDQSKKKKPDETGEWMSQQ